MRYQEPTIEQIERDSKALYPVGFKATIQDFEDMGVAVRNHEMVSVKMFKMSDRVKGEDSLYCFKYDSTTKMAKIVLKVASTTYDGAIAKNYTLVKSKNSDTVEVYDTHGNFAKKFKLFE